MEGTIGPSGNLEFPLSWAMPIAHTRLPGSSWTVSPDCQPPTHPEKYIYQWRSLAPGLQNPNFTSPRLAERVPGGPRGGPRGGPEGPGIPKISGRGSQGVSERVPGGPRGGPGGSPDYIIITLWGSWGVPGGVRKTPDQKVAKFLVIYGQKRLSTRSFLRFLGSPHFGQN